VIVFLGMPLTVERWRSGEVMFAVLSLSFHKNLLLSCTSHGDMQDLSFLMQELVLAAEMSADTSSGAFLR